MVTVSVFMFLLEYYLWFNLTLMRREWDCVDETGTSDKNGFICDLITTQQFMLQFLNLKAQIKMKTSK